MQVSRRIAAGVVAAALGAGVAGCGSAGGGAASGGAASVQHHELDEISRLFRAYRKGNKPPPKSEKDFLPFEHGFPLGIGAIKQKQIIVCWGAGLSDSADAASTVLAYEKTTPESGGVVLLQDGSVRAMTAEEFKAAPKAK
jgi:hypothetical protein